MGKYSCKLRASVAR